MNSSSNLDELLTIDTKDAAIRLHREAMGVGGTIPTRTLLFIAAFALFGAWPCAAADSSLAPGNIPQSSRLIALAAAKFPCFCEFVVTDAEASGDLPVLNRRVRLRGSTLRYYLWTQILAGWLLSAIFVAGVTGLIRND